MRTINESPNCVAAQLGDSSYSVRILCVHTDRSMLKLNPTMVYGSTSSVTSISIGQATELFMPCPLTVQIVILSTWQLGVDSMGGYKGFCFAIENYKVKVDSAAVSVYNNSEVRCFSGMAFQFFGYMARRLCPWVWK